jgi:hypothetical protein
VLEWGGEGALEVGEAGEDFDAYGAWAAGAGFQSQEFALVEAAGAGGCWWCGLCVPGLAVGFGLLLGAVDASAELPEAAEHGVAGSGASVVGFGALAWFGHSVILNCSCPPAVQQREIWVPKGGVKRISSGLHLLVASACWV